MTIRKNICSCKTPGRNNFYDLRQEEKERFVRLIASAPSRLNERPPPKRKGRIEGVRRVEDLRQKEKERLASIFAMSVGSTQRNDNKYNCRRPTPIDQGKENLTAEKTPLIEVSINFKNHPNIHNFLKKSCLLFSLILSMGWFIMEL